MAVDILRHLVLPLLVLMAIPMGEAMLLMRSAMANVLRDDHVWLARAKGIGDGQLRDRHVARLALPPVLSRFLLQLPFVLVGSFAIERLFFLRGMGQALFTAADRQDLPVLIGVLSIVAILLLAAHVALDLVCLWLDPRLRVTALRPLDR